MTKKETTSVSLRQDQMEWIKDNIKWFNFSKWVQTELNKLIVEINKMGVKQK